MNATAHNHHSYQKKKTPSTWYWADLWQEINVVEPEKCGFWEVYVTQLSFTVQLVEWVRLREENVVSFAKEDMAHDDALVRTIEINWFNRKRMWCMREVQQASST